MPNNADSNRLYSASIVANRLYSASIVAAESTAALQRRLAL